VAMSRTGGRRISCTVGRLKPARRAGGSRRGGDPARCGATDGRRGARRWLGVTGSASLLLVAYTEGRTTRARIPEKFDYGRATALDGRFAWPPRLLRRLRPRNGVGRPLRMAVPLLRRRADPCASVEPPRGPLARPPSPRARAHARPVRRRRPALARRSRSA
jgi:hypothetical protein